MSTLNETKNTLADLMNTVDDSICLIDTKFEYTAEYITDLIEVKAMFVTLRNKLEKTYKKIK
jgi:hypothetical protein